MRSIFNQSVLPDEILIADDGSGEETRKLIEQLKRESPVPVRHVWHPDRGFRVGAIRNKAIHQAHGDYIIQIDGDIVVHPNFVADHIRFARRGSYVTGSRVVLTEEYTQHVFDTGNIHISLFAKRPAPQIKRLAYARTHAFYDKLQIQELKLRAWLQHGFLARGSDKDKRL